MNSWRLLAKTPAFFLLLLVAFLARVAGPQKSPPKPAAKSAPSKAARALGSGPQFVDVARASGIDSHLTCGSGEKRYIMESMCGGIAAFDFDNDGWIDILFVDGSTLADLRSPLLPCGFMMGDRSARAPGLPPTGKTGQRLGTPFCFSVNPRSPQPVLCYRPLLTLRDDLAIKIGDPA